MTIPLESLLNPSSIAVVGASDNIHKVGGRPLQYLAQQGYRGRVYPVNPRASTIQGLTAYATLDALPEVPEAVILCVASEAVEEQLSLCARLGVGNVVLFASGYAEVGPEGLARQKRITDLCRGGGVRLLGPNSIGVASFDSGAVLSFASIYADCTPQDGPVAIVSQSGAFGVALYALLREQGVGVRCVAATGNEADLDTADFVGALAARTGIRLILLYVENIVDLARMRQALAVTRNHGVRVVAVRAGRSPEGRRSAGLHTGSGGAANETLDQFFRESGCRTVDDMDTLLHCVPGYLRDGVSLAALAAPRLVVVSNSGASCVLASDQAYRLQLRLASLSPASRTRLDGLLPVFSHNRNPIDMTAMLLAQPALLGEVVDCAMADGGTDAVVLGLLAIGGPSYDVQRFASDCRVAADAHAKALWVFSPHPHVQRAFAQQGFPVFAGEVDAMSEIAGLAAHLKAFLPSGATNLSTEPLHA